MDQNINLLTDIPTRQVSFLEGKTIFNIIIIYVVILAVISGISWWFAIIKNDRIKELNVTRQHLISQLESISQQLGSMKKEIPLFSGMVSIRPSHILGFSRYLDDLAEFTPEGVWLQEIIFAQPEDAITLKGTAISASLLPILLKTITKSDDLTEKKFSTLQLQKIDKTNYIQFTLSTVAETDTTANTTSTTAGNP